VNKVVRDDMLRTPAVYGKLGAWNLASNQKFLESHHIC